MTEQVQDMQEIRDWFDRTIAALEELQRFAVEDLASASFDELFKTGVALQDLGAAIQNKLIEEGLA